MTAAQNKLVIEARNSWLADDHEAALDLFRNAYKAAPDDLRLAVECASYLGMRFEIDEATEILQHCERELTHNAAGLHHVGLAYERAFLPDQALRCFQHVVQGDPRHHPSWIKIAEWFDRRGMLDEAVDAIRQSPAQLPEVQLALARFHVRRGEHTAAEQLLTKLTVDGVADDIRIRAGYELAGIYDVAGEADLAIQAASSAKTLQKRHAMVHLKQAQELARLEASFVTTVEPAHYQRWSSEVTHPPVALLTGSPRSGTTLMARALGNHASVHLADEVNAYATYIHKEMLTGAVGSNAGDVLDAIPAARLVESRSRYQRWMHAAIGTQDLTGVLLDKNPSTTFLIPAFRRLLPQAAIIIAIRDPRDVVVSCFLQHFPLNPVSAMFTQLDLTVMRCRAELEAWLRLRDKLTQPWCEIRYEQLVAGDESVLSSALVAMGLDGQDDLLRFQSGLRTSAVRSPTYAQLFEPVHTKSVGRWQRYEEALRPFLSQLEPVCRRLGYA